MISLRPYVVLLGVAAVGAAASEVSGENEILFETHIRPVFAAACYECHGPDRQDGGLRLDTRAGFLHGAAHPELPETIRARARDALHVIIDPAGEGHPSVDVSGNARRHIETWISLGATWPADRDLSRSEQSMAARIATSRATHWAFQPVSEPELPPADRHPIDALLESKLSEAGLELSPPADRRTLIRRAYFDLIGLPPTFEETQTFINDDSPDAFDNVIDRLLASPRYGERWGRHWLDVARYSDTKGQDAVTQPFFPFSYTYRDYVIRAFNEDLPYDQFIIEQLAADQLDLGGDKRALAALGFITLGRQFPGDLHATLDDQIDVVTRGFMGLTVSCARCHDHKHDPIPTADYYSLYGVFRSARTPAEYPLIQEDEPGTDEYAAYKARLGKLTLAREELISEHYALIAEKARKDTAKYLETVYDTLNLTDEDTIKSLIDERGLHPRLFVRWKNYLMDDARLNDPVLSAWRAFAAIDGDFENKAQAVIAQFGSNTNPIIKKRFTDSPPSSMADVHSRYATLFDEANKSWLNVVEKGGDIAAISGCKFESVPAELPDLNMESIRQVLYGEDSPARITRDEVHLYMDDAARAKLAARDEAIRNHKYTHPARPDRAMAVQNTPKPFDSYIFVRGNADSKGDPVPHRFLEVIEGPDREAFPEGESRLALAKAIASKDNPLTARVMVNRIWMHHFGRPIVATPSDFGLRGSPPSHPKLLDHLAHTFMDSGWSVKALHRHIMQSKAYQQASAETPKLMEADPDNELFSRQTRRRMDFEAMRDSLLAAADNLDLTMGGKSESITERPFSKRRAVYALIDRQYLPTVFGTFDFASPNAHRAKRHTTTVPQQALFMMNSPFVAQQASALAEWSETKYPDAPQDRIAAMYRRLFLRDPLDREVDLAKEFINTQDTAPVVLPDREPERWLYGTGTVNEADGRIENFAELPYWSGEAYQGAEKLPAPVLANAQLGRYGGHPGGPDHAVVRRWVSPVDSTVSFVGELFHYSSAGDGITAYVVSSREGILWQGSLQDEMLPTVFHDSQVRKGDTIDLVVACNADDADDRFKWHPRLYLSGEDATKYPKQDWLTRFDFAPPPPKFPEPLTTWEKYAQVLLMSNEFLFID